MKKLIVYAVMIVLSFVVNGHAKEVTFDTSKLGNTEVKIIGTKKTFTIPARGSKQTTFNLEKTKKGLFGRGIEGYVKDIEVEQMKASDVKGLIEYINGIIDTLNQPTLRISKGGTGLSVTLISKQITFKHLEENTPPFQAEIKLSNDEKKLYQLPASNPISLNLTDRLNQAINSFVIYAVPDTLRATTEQITEINKWINESLMVQDPLIINYTLRRDEIKNSPLTIWRSMR